MWTAILTLLFAADFIAQSPLYNTNLLATLALAEEQAEEEESASNWEWGGPSGKASQLLHGYTEPFSNYSNVQQRIDIDGKLSLTNYEWTAKLNPWVWLQVPYNQGGERKGFKPFFELKEGWLEYASALFDVRLGNQMISWGTADKVNPTDVVNPWDYYDPLEARKLPALLAKIDLHPEFLEGWNLQIVGTPLFVESRLPLSYPGSDTLEIPTNDSRWLISVPTSLEASGIRIPLTYLTAAPSYPSSWSAGARLSVSGLGGWDFSASTYHGVEQTARIGFTKVGDATDPDLPITITMHPSYHRYSMYGLDGAGSISLFDRSIGLRFEGAYFHRNNDRAATAPDSIQADLTKKDYIHLVGGLDYTFETKFFGTVAYLNLQYVFYQTIGGSESTPGELVITGLPNTIPWDRNIVLYLENRFNEKFKFTNSILWSHENRDVLYQPELQGLFFDNLAVSLGYQLLRGRNTGFFGQFKDNSRLFLKASWTF